MNDTSCDKTIKTKTVTFSDISLNDIEMQSPSDQILTNDGLFEYIKNVYFYTGIGWSLTLIAGELMSLTINKANFNVLQSVYIILGFFMSIIFMMPSISSTYNGYDSSTSEMSVINTTNSTYQKKEIIPTWKILSFLAFSYFLGFMTSPVFYIVNQYNSLIFPISILITIFVFCSMQIYTYTRKDMSGLSCYGPLMICVSGLIILGIIEIILSAVGFDKTACLLTFGTSIISIIVFCGLIFVDTLKAIDSYNKSELNTIRCAVEIVLDLANILINIMQILINLMPRND